MLRKVFILFFVLCVTRNVVSQQLPQYSQYMLNGFMFNSAMAGYDGFTTFDFTTRQQWLGITDAPRTISISLQTRILKRSYIIKHQPLKQKNTLVPARTGRVGLGINLYSDRNGAFSNTGITMSYAYHIPFPNSQLSFGISGSISQLKIDINASDFRNPINENTIDFNKVPNYVPDANIGIFYNNRQLYAGFSVAELIQSSLKFGSNIISNYQLKRHYYLLAGYRLNSQLNVTYEPTILIKTTEQFLPQVDFSIKAYIYENYWMGVSYRTTNTAIFFLGVRKNRLYASYAFDYSFNALQNFTFGTHELNLALKFGDSAKRYRWINRY